MITEELAHIYFEKRQEVREQKERIGVTRLKIQQAMENGKFIETLEIQKQLEKDLIDQSNLLDKLSIQEGNIGKNLIQRFQHENIPFNSEQNYRLSETSYFTVIVKSENSLVINGPLSEL